MGNGLGWMTVTLRVFMHINEQSVRGTAWNSRTRILRPLSSMYGKMVQNDKWSHNGIMPVFKYISRNYNRLLVILPHILYCT